MVQKVRESSYYNPAYTSIRDQGRSHIYADTYAVYYGVWRLQGDNHTDASAKAYKYADMIVRR